jgi:hypothetical protein
MMELNVSFTRKVLNLRSFFRNHPFNKAFQKKSQRKYQSTALIFSQITVYIKALVNQNKDGDNITKSEAGTNMTVLKI